MSAGPFLLRLLLSATLILNGASGWATPTGHAVEARVATTGVQDASRHATVEAAPRMPCHEAEAHRVADTPVHPLEIPVAIADADPDDLADDCCDSGVCDCGCVHHGGVGFTAQVFRAHDTHDPQSLVALAREHLAPMLPHLIRPPIG